MPFDRHICARCGHRWDVRTNAIYDELVSWIHHCDALEAEYRRENARLQWRLSVALEDVAQLRALVKMLVVPNIEQIELQQLRSVVVRDPEPETID